MTALNLLQQRNSAPKLEAPAPDAAQLEQMFLAAVRAPDHAWLTPWRFLVVRGEARQRLGELFIEAALARGEALSAEQRQKYLEQPLRAPLLVVVVVRQVEHPKVPAWEQLVSAGCAAHGLLLAAEAQGFAGIWRTGVHAEDRHVATGLGLDGDERVVGFLYMGTRAGAAKPLPRRPLDAFVSDWEGVS